MMSNRSPILPPHVEQARSITTDTRPIPATQAVSVAPGSRYNPVMVSRKEQGLRQVREVPRRATHEHVGELGSLSNPRFVSREEQQARGEAQLQREPAEPALSFDDVLRHSMRADASSSVSKSFRNGFVGGFMNAPGSAPLMGQAVSEMVTDSATQLAEGSTAQEVSPRRSQAEELYARHPELRAAGEAKLAAREPQELHPQAMELYARHPELSPANRQPRPDESEADYHMGF